MTWVDPKTGEIHDAPAEGLLEVDLAEPEEARAQPDLDWLGDWYTQQLTRIDAEEAAIKTQHEARLAEVQARRKALKWRWGEELKEHVRGLLAGAKKKSVNFAYGKVGFRKASHVIVEDEESALRWARRHCPAAVKLRHSLLKSQLPDNQDVPGVRRWSGDEFFARGAKP